MAVKKTGEFMIVNRRSKKALQATGLDNGLPVEQAAAAGTDAQLWTAVETVGGVKLFNKATGKVLDVMQGGTENGTWAQTWEDVDGGADPDVAADGDGIGVFQAGITSFAVDGMAGCVKAAIGCNEDIVTKGDGSAVQDDRVVVGEEIVTYVDIVAIVAPERSHNSTVFALTTQKLFQDSGLLFRF